MENIILFRKELATEEEFDICNKYFNVVEHRSDIKDGLVFGRYSVLPYYKELEYDLINHNSLLINSYQQHNWIANFEWYEILKEYTFPTWFNAMVLPEKEAPFIVKGRTNSKKHDWDTLMYAETKKRAIEIAYELSKDALVGNQGIVYRKYEKLITYEVGINGLPFTKEFRFFFYKGQILSYGYYWIIADNIDIELDDDGYIFAQKIGNIVKDYVNFYVIDIAQKENGDWILIELNDACMSGLSGNDAETLYKNLKTCLDKEKLLSL